MLYIPLTSWPISWSDIAHNLNNKKPASPAVTAAMGRVRRQMRKALYNFDIHPSYRLSAADSPLRFRTFRSTPRETAEVEIGTDWVGEHFSTHLRGSIVRRPEDNRHLRIDGSYTTILLGNWMVAADAVDRWWGPGWEGSLIMSNNARPIPGFTIRRNHSDAFDLPVLRWLGPWQFTFSTGILETSRAIPHALLTRMRLSFKPTPGLEISLSRAAQWGGRGRPRNLSTFLRMLGGRDNVGEAGITAANQPGNQLAGYDVRWASPLFDLPYAIYAQLIGEDESRRFPIQYMGLFGGEIWGGWGDSGASWRLHVEYADTAAHLLGGTLRNRNVAYEHSVYRSGFRYFGRSLGHSIDGDGRSYSVGGVFVTAEGSTWEMLGRRIEVNRDSSNPGTVKIPFERVYELDLWGKIDVASMQLSFGIGAERSKGISGDSNIGSHAEIELEQRF